MFRPRNSQHPRELEQELRLPHRYESKQKPTSESLAHQWFRYVVVFLGGAVTSLALIRISSQLTNSCQISYGAYKGSEYRSSSTIGSALCLVESKFLKVQQHGVRLPGSSSVIEDWLWIDYHDRINVLVEVQDGRFAVFEQTKYALEDRQSLAIVGGIIEPGELAQTAAQREVLEEMGLECKEWILLGRYRTDVNRGMGWTNTFLASKCYQKQRPAAHGLDGAEEVGVPDMERQDRKTLTLDELRAAVTGNKFLEIQWTATISLAILYLQNEANTDSN